MGRIIDAALEFRITEISPPKFTARDVGQVQLELLREATDRATEQAAVIATANHGRLGRALYLGTQSPNAYLDRYGFGLESLVVSGTAASGGTEITAPRSRWP